MRHSNSALRPATLMATRPQLQIWSDSSSAERPRPTRSTINSGSPSGARISTTPRTSIGSRRRYGRTPGRLTAGFTRRRGWRSAPATPLLGLLCRGLLCRGLPCRGLPRRGLPRRGLPWPGLPRCGLVRLPHGWALPAAQAHWRPAGPRSPDAWHPAPVTIGRNGSSATASRPAEAAGSTLPSGVAAQAGGAGGELRPSTQHAATPPSRTCRAILAI